MTKEEIQKRLREALKTLPMRAQVRRISLFGSQLHAMETENSDIDFIVEFCHPVSMFKLVRMERELSKAFAKKVDLSTPNSLSRYFRDDVLQEAETLYEAAV